MPQRILVVDDSPTVRRIVGRTLGQAGYDVRLATDGRDALDKLADEVPDLVLVDFVMPQMNGLRFVQTMRGIANLSAVPVVLMSAKADKIGDGFVAQTGAVDAITKPFSPEALLAVTGHALSRAAQSAETATAPLPDDTPPGGVPPVLELPPETSPEALAAAGRAIAERLATAASESFSGLAPGPLAAAIASRFDPAALFSLARDLGALVPGRDGEHALEGRLEHVALGDVLQLLTQQRQSGVVEVQREGIQRSVHICLEHGAVQLALADAEDTEFRLGRYLLREGLIEHAELERILRHRGRGRSLLGTHLVKLGYLSADELTKTLVQQTSEVVYEALRWRRGRFRFVRFASRPEAVDARLGLPLASILMEGLRRVDEWRLIEEQIHSFDEVPRADREALAHVDPSTFGADERLVLDAIDGDRSVRQVVEHTRMASFDACKILFRLLTSRLVRIADR